VLFKDPILTNRRDYVFVNDRKYDLLPNEKVIDLMYELFRYDTDV